MAHILHTSKSSSNEHVQQDWYKSSGNKIVENLNFDLFVQNDAEIFYTLPNVAATS